MAIRKVSWTKTAVKQFNNAINYIPEDIDKQAEKVKQIILNKVNKLSNDNIVHRQDQYKRNNDGNYLFFEILHYRIAFFTTPNEVFIIRVPHTIRAPKTN